MRQQYNFRGFGDSQPPCYFINNSRPETRFCEACEKIKAVEEFSTAYFDCDRHVCNKCRPKVEYLEDDM